MDYKKSIEEIEKVLVELKNESKDIPIIVEGEKDKRALRKLNIKRKIIILNEGISLTNFCDKIAKKYNEIILITDWDRKGGFLRRRIQENLKGRVLLNTRYREVFAKNTTTKTVEGLPSWIKTVNDKT